jgi:spore coat protein U-like protein
MNPMFSISNIEKPIIKRKFTAFSLIILMVFSSFSIVYAAGIGNINVSATILSNSNCRFQNLAPVVAFGNLDPGNPVVVNASATIDFRCMGAAGTAVFVITQDGGLNPLGPRNQMEHLLIPGQFLPYDLTLIHVPPPIPKNQWETLTIQATVNGADYQVPAGDYQDTVVISIVP